MPDGTSAKPRRRRWRFGVSLRVMMLLIVAVGCALGWKVRRADTQRRAVAQIAKSGAMILQYDYQFRDGRPVRNGTPWAPAWLRKSIGDEYFQEVTSVQWFSATDADLAPLAACDRLEAVWIGDKRISDAGLAHLENLTGLLALTIHDAPITDAGLAHLKRLTRLRKLDFDQNVVDFSSVFPNREERALQDELSRRGLPPREVARQLWLRRHPHITSAGLAYLAGMTRMEELSLRAPGVTDEGLVSLRGMIRLRKLNLSNTGINGAGLIHLKGMSALRELDLASTGVTDAALAHLSGMSGLRTLDLSNTKISDTGLAYLKGLNRLEVLKLRWGPEITDAGLASLSGLTHLRELELSGRGMTDAGLAHLAGLVNLEKLKIPGAQITDAGLAHLAGLKALTTLDLSHSQITGPGLVHLHALPVLRHVDLQVTTVSDEAADALREAIPGVEVTYQTRIQILAEQMKHNEPSAAVRSAKAMMDAKPTTSNGARKIRSE